MLITLESLRIRLNATHFNLKIAMFALFSMFRVGETFYEL